MSYTDIAVFHYHRLRHELGNYAARRLAQSDGAIVSMHQSGTHWLKYMLACAMAEAYGVAPPQYNHANDIIGGPKDRPRHPHIPHLVSTHTIAPLAYKIPFVFRRADVPPIVLLVRDLRASLVSNYRKWQRRYGVPFAEYVRGDPAGRRFNSDIWWCIRFQNAWGDLAARHERTFLVVRYEDIERDPPRMLAQVVGHFALPLSAQHIAAGVAAASKRAMAARADPARPPGEVNANTDDPLEQYEPADREYVQSRCAAFLRRDFGYDYSVW